MIVGASYVDEAKTTGASFVCRAGGGSGSFTIPPGILLSLPPGPNGTITFQAGPAAVNFAVSGLTLSSIDFNAALTNSVTFQ